MTSNPLRFFPPATSFVSGSVRVFGMATVAVAGALGSALLTAGGPGAALQETPDDPALPVVARVCGKCHPLERVTAMRRSRSQWEEVITTMITARAAQVTDEEFDVILGYLTREYGRVNVNRAPAEDLVEVLHITDAGAGAIVAYRREHGPFVDFDALLKVPEVNREALEKRRDAITY